MTDTARTKADVLALLADNTSGDISAQDLRDYVVSVTDPVDGGGFHGHYSPDAPPLTADANANDDEFSDASVSGSWTTWNPGSSITVTESDYDGLKIVNNAASLKAGGVFKAIPGGDFTATAKISQCADLTNNNYAGLMLGQDLTNNPTTSDFWILATNNNELTLSAWSSYTTFGSNTVQHAFKWPAVYMRISRVSTTYRFLYSTDGVAWVKIHDTTSTPFTPAEVGLATITDHGGTVAEIGRFRFYRQTPGADYYEPIKGRVGA